MSLNPQQEKILTAFVTALAHQDESLPLGLQKQLNAIGQNLEARIMELPAIAVRSAAAFALGVAEASRRSLLAFLPSVKVNWD